MLRSRILHPLNWKYALGEILLIFIGINLAIWFNNWNETRKLKEEEKRILQSILTDLEDDQAANEHSILVLNKELDRVRQILHWTEGKIELTPDSLGKLLPFLVKDHTVNIQSTGYQTLISKGISLVQKKPLRKELIRYYDDMDESIRELARHSNELLKFQIPYFTSHFEYFDFWGESPALPKDIERLRADAEFKVLVQLAYYAKDRILVIHEALEGGEIRQLRELIQSELSHFE
jgi:hypothetical protein